MILNELETRLHPDLLPLLAQLAQLIEQAARHAQVVAVSHAAELVFVLEADADCADRPGEGSRRNRRQEQHATRMDVAFAVINLRVP